VGTNDSGESKLKGAEGLEDDAINEIREVLKSQHSLHEGSNTALSASQQNKKPKGHENMIVTAVKSFKAQSKAQLEFEAGDVLLITNTDDSSWWQGMHDATRKTGLIRADYVKEMDTLFAEVVAMAESETKQGEKPINQKSSNSQPKDKAVSEVNRNSNISISSKASEDSTKPRSPGLEDKSWVHKVGEEISNRLTVDERKRQEAIFEFIETERSFLDDMEKVLGGYMAPLRSSKLMSEADIDSVFSNLEEIVTATKEIVKTCSNLQLKQGAVIQTFGKTLLEVLPSFKQYAPFCSNISNAVQVLQTKKKESTQFATKLHEYAQDPYFGGLDLSSYLLKPMQRITKIPLLIKSIIKHTPANSADFPDLTAAEAESQEIVLLVNTKCGEVEEFRRYTKLQERLNQDLTDDLGIDILDIKKRKLVHAATVQLNDRTVFAFLFDDMFFFATVKVSSKSDKYCLFKAASNLWLLELLPVVEAPKQQTERPRKGSSAKSRFTSFSRPLLPEEQQRSFSFIDHLAEQTFEVVTSNSKGRDNWVHAIRQAQFKLQESAVVTIDKIKPVPTGTKKFQTGPNFNNVATIDSYYLLSGEGGFHVSVIDDTGGWKSVLVSNKIGD
jgi:hypothetical protein